MATRRRRIPDLCAAAHPKEVKLISGWFCGGAERACVDLKEVDELAQALDLEDEDLGALYEQLHAKHIELRDDCTRQDAPEAPIDDAHFATVTTDTLQLF